MAYAEPLIITFAKGEWDFSDRDDLEKLLAPTYTHPNVVLDMSAATYADSAVLGELFTMRRKRSERGFTTESIVVNARVRRLLEVVGAVTTWSLYDKLEDALAERPESDLA